jgi:hypothetical protein
VAYPATIDDFRQAAWNNATKATQNPGDEQNAAVVGRHAQHHIDLGNGLFAVETELGITPKGTFSDLAARFAAQAFPLIVRDTPGAQVVNVSPKRIPIPAACDIVDVMVMVNTAPTGASLIVDVNKNGVTVFTTQANRPTIPAASFSSGRVTNMNITSLAVGDYLSADVDQIGSTIAGSDLVVMVRVRWK